jgi:hypothetical protein
LVHCWFRRNWVAIVVLIRIFGSSAEVFPSFNERITVRVPASIKSSDTAIYCARPVSYEHWFHVPSSTGAILKHNVLDERFPPTIENLFCVWKVDVW